MTGHFIVSSISDLTSYTDQDFVGRLEKEITALQTHSNNVDDPSGLILSEKGESADLLVSTSSTCSELSAYCSATVHLTDGVWGD